MLIFFVEMFSCFNNEKLDNFSFEPFFLLKNKKLKNFFHNKFYIVLTTFFNIKIFVWFKNKKKLSFMKFFQILIGFKDVFHIT